MYSDWQARPDSLDPDQTLQKVVAAKSPQCLPLIHQLFRHVNQSKISFFKSCEKYGQELKCPKVNEDFFNPFNPEFL